MEPFRGRLPQRPATSFHLSLSCPFRTCMRCHRTQRKESQQWLALSWKWKGHYDKPAARPAAGPVSFDELICYFLVLYNLGAITKSKNNTIIQCQKWKKNHAISVLNLRQKGCEREKKETASHLETRGYLHDAMKYKIPSGKRRRLQPANRLLKPWTWREIQYGNGVCKDSIREGWLQTAEDPSIFLSPYDTFQLQEQKYFTVRIGARASIKVAVS